MNLSDFGFEFIRRQEGFVPHVYPDEGGVPTIGYGHVLAPHEAHLTTISEPDGRGLLRQDVSYAEAAVRRLVRTELSPWQFDALVSLVFNAGEGAFGASRMRAALNRGDLAAAVVEFDDWHHVTVNGVKRASGVLQRRRAIERAMFEGKPIDIVATTPGSKRPWLLASGIPGAVAGLPPGVSSGSVAGNGGVLPPGGTPQGGTPQGGTPSTNGSAAPEAVGGLAILALAWLAWRAFR